MANVILYDPASTPVANRVLRYIRSVQESDWQGKPGALVNQDGSGDNPQVTALIATAVPITRWKVVGANVEQLSADDDAAIASDIATKQAAADAAYIVEARANAKAMMDRMDEMGRQLRAFAEVVVDEINILRGQHSLAARTLTQLRNAINTKIDAR